MLQKQGGLLPGGLHRMDIMRNASMDQLMLISRNLVNLEQNRNNSPHASAGPAQTIPSHCIHVIPTPFPQARPSPAAPLSHPGPPIMRRYALDPDQHRTHGKIRVRELTAHSDDAIPIGRPVLVQDNSEKIELLLHCKPSLFTLWARR